METATVGSEGGAERQRGNEEVEGRHDHRSLDLGTTLSPSRLSSPPRPIDAFLVFLYVSAFSLSCLLSLCLGCWGLGSGCVCWLALRVLHVAGPKGQVVSEQLHDD